jgi:hypothetical protein
MAHKTSITLHVTGPDGATASASSEQESIIIGSGAGAAFQVADPGVSSLHCLIKVEQGRVAVIDLGSASGTLVRDRPIREPAVLESGETIALGGSRIRVTYGDRSTSTVDELPAPPAGDGASERRWRSSQPPPTERDRSLEIGLWWGRSLVGLVRPRPGLWVTIGDGGDCDFEVTDVGPRFELARANGSTAEVRLPPSATLEVSRQGDALRGREALTAAGRLRGRPGGDVLELGLQDQALITASGLTFSLRFIRPLPRLTPVALSDRDFSFFRTVSVCFLFFFALVGAIAVTPFSEGGDGDDLFANPSRYVRLVSRPEKKVDLSRFQALSRAAEAKRVKERTGSFGKPSADKTAADPSRRGAPTVERDKRDEDRKKVSLLMAGMFGGGSSSNLFGSGGLGSGINNALGGLKGGAGLGDAQGLGGLGARGAGVGGGGTGLGLGGLGTRGAGQGGGGYGSVDLGGRGKDTVRIIPGKTTIVGGLDREVIMKVIKRHQNEIKFCYEAELQKNPALAGKIAVAWTIDPAGLVSEASVSESSMANAAVEGCILERIRRWKFPEPAAGGVVAVTFPWIFKAAGDAPGE